MNTEIRTYRNVQYLHADYQGTRTNEELLGILEKGVEFVRANPNLSRIFANFNDTFLSPEFMRRMKTLGTERNVKAALIGITGLKKGIINGISSVTKFEVRVFDNEAEALDWLVS